MSSYIARYEKRRLRSSYISVALSITVVLLLVGLLCTLVFNASKLGNYFKEQLVVTAYLSPTVKEVEKAQLITGFEVSQQIAQVEFISKEEAARSYSEEIGQDFVQFLGFNPLRDGLEVSLKAPYVSVEQIERLARDLTDKPFVEEVIYDTELLGLLESNFAGIQKALLIGAAFLLLFSIVLINSSIRLSIYSKRLVIKTLRLVGAKKAFIRWPFIWINLRLGLLGATLASGTLVALYLELDSRFPKLALSSDVTAVSGIIALLYLMGIVITVLSTYLATSRFLTLKATNDFS
ncbi:MAG: permease-like cell division protein FtsX [Bacteroidetes bacterium]|nr:permease-like cell division protein FtsX [Bacteroidota bacterium]